MCNPAAIATVAGGYLAVEGGKKLLSPGKAASAAETLPPSKESPPDVSASMARDRARRRALLAYGQPGTMLTGGQGAGLPATAGAKTLLGS